VYQEQRNDGACADVYRKLADLHRRRGDEDKAREIMQRFVPAADLAAHGDVDITLGADDEFDDIGMEGDDGLLDEDLLANDDLLEGGASLENAIEADDDPIDLMSPIAEQAPEEIQELEEIQEPAEELEPDAPAPVPPSGDPDQLLAEASVYLRYGESAQAIANLEAILAKDPNHRKALEKLGEALADSGDDLRAVETWGRAAGLAREAGDSDALSVLRGRIASLDEEAAAALDDGEIEVDDADLDIALDDDEVEAALQEDDVAPELTADDDPSIGDDPDTDEIALGDIEIDIDESTLGGEVEASDAEDDVGDVDTTVDFDGDDGEIEEEAQGLSASVTAQIGEDLEEADFYMQQGLHDEAVVIYRRILLASPDHPTAKLRLGEIEAAGGGDAVAAPDPSLEDTAVEEEEESFDVDDADLDDDIDVSDEIAEDDAAAEVEVAVPEVDETTQPAEVEADDDEAYLDVVPDDVVAPPQAASASDAGFDLAAELSDAFDDDANASSARGATGGDDNFAAVFDEFKKGVSKQLTDSDHEAHYDLGIAYREMGLHDDAMTEFRKAMTSPSRQIDCLHMLGICAIEVGRGEEAIGFLEQALQSSEVSDEQALAAQFEVGRAYELTGDLDRARTAFETVRDVEPGFCDVEERIENLGSGEKPDAETGTDGFENFDDLMEDDEDDVPTPEAAETYESFDDVFEDDDDGDEPEAPAAVPKAAPAKSKKRPAAKKTAKKKKKKISFV
jgi:tetratricopeptide (TPR) repeat protein